MRYSIDSSAIIEAWQRVYPIDIFAGFWERLGQAASGGEVAIAEEVHTELQKKDDQVLKWVNQYPEMVVPIDIITQTAVREILASYPRLIDNRRNRSGGDPWVIAVAMVNGLTVVTYERHTGSLAKPNIPDVCDAIGIECIDVVGLIRAEGWHF